MQQERTSKALKVGDTVMVIAGGNKHKRPNKGQTGKILSLIGKKKDRAIVEGVNIITKHKRANQPGEAAGRIQQEASIHVSNLMFFPEKLGKPVRLRRRKLEDGRSVRGYMDPEKKEFVQVD